MIPPQPKSAYVKMVYQVHAGEVPGYEEGDEITFQRTISVKGADEKATGSANYHVCIPLPIAGMPRYRARCEEDNARQNAGAGVAIRYSCSSTH